MRQLYIEYKPCRKCGDTRRYQVSRRCPSCDAARGYRKDKKNEVRLRKICTKINIEELGAGNVAARKKIEERELMRSLGL